MHSAPGGNAPRFGSLHRACGAVPSGTGWFEGASLKQLAHVGNKLSKHQNLPACMEAIAWIAGELTQADDLVGLGATRQFFC